MPCILPHPVGLVEHSPTRLVVQHMVEEQFCIRPISLDTPYQVEAFYEDLSVAIAWGYKRLVVDLAQVSFVRPDGVIALVTAARLWHTWTGHRIVLINMQQRVHCYLERIDLFGSCAAWLMQDHELSTTEQWDRNPESASLLELLPIAGDEERNARDVGSAVGRAGQILRRWFDAHDNAIRRVMTLISEISSNVTHSLDHGFAVMQRYRDGTRMGSIVVIAIADLGIGIKASLNSKPQGLILHNTRTPLAGSEFILHALDLGVTSRAEIGGLGLPRVKTIVEDCQGSLRIRSFSSEVLFIGHEMQARDNLVEIPGTQVIIEVRSG